MKTYHVKLVNAFTRTLFAGNPAGVVLDAEGLTDPQMQLIAREFNTPETAFFFPAAIPNADLRIRWFSPVCEVPLCGHATIAGFHALAEEGMRGMKVNGQHYFRLQTKSGVLPIRVEKNFYDTSVEFELPIPKFKMKKKIPLPLLKSLGLSLKDLRGNIPSVMDSYIYIPLKRLARLKKIIPQYTLLAHSLKALKVNGVCVFSLEGTEKESAVHSRFFAPNFGINEDPVTGSANGPLGCYLAKYVLPAGISAAHRELSDGRIEFIGEQGDEIQRKGRVKIRVRCTGKKIDHVSISGEAVTVFNTTIMI